METLHWLWGGDSEIATHLSPLMPQKQILRFAQNDRNRGPASPKKRPRFGTRVSRNNEKLFGSLRTPHPDRPSMRPESIRGYSGLAVLFVPGGLNRHGGRSCIAATDVIQLSRDSCITGRAGGQCRVVFL